MGDLFKLKNLACMETGCDGVISLENEKDIYFHRESPTKFKKTGKCPQCSRLHDTLTGRPIRNDQQKKVFLSDTNGEQHPVYHPIDSKEMSVYISGLMLMSSLTKNQAELDSIRHDLLFITKKGHALDCSYKMNEKNVCSCGRTEALRYLGATVKPGIHIPCLQATQSRETRVSQ